MKIRAGNKVLLPNGQEGKVNSVKGEQAWVDGHGIYAVDLLRRANVPNEAKITQEWLKDVGLCGDSDTDGLKEMHGSSFYGGVVTMIVGDDGLFVVTFMENAVESLITEGIKTVGDVRQLCRLLSLRLEE